jgi:hypothetical protein
LLSVVGKVQHGPTSVTLDLATGFTKAALHICREWPFAVRVILCCHKPPLWMPLFPLNNHPVRLVSSVFRCKPAAYPGKVFEEPFNAPTLITPVPARIQPGDDLPRLILSGIFS